MEHCQGVIELALAITLQALLAALEREAHPPLAEVSAHGVGEGRLLAGRPVRLRVRVWVGGSLVAAAEPDKKKDGNGDGEDDEH